ncbi:MAG: OmpA family protein [Candidatus Aphodousia sp.]|nr:OmpA family protein [Candidatus Aphodousia sp.]
MKKVFAMSAAMAAMLTFGGVAQATDIAPYVTSSSKEIVKSGYDLCWRTGFWTPALAEGTGCDGDVANSGKIVLAADTLFDLNSARVKPEGVKMLQELVARMSGLNVDVVMATGYTDETGPADFNQALSERRAEAVKNIMVREGVPADKIQTEGKGPANPVVTCTEGQSKAEFVACLAPNRRTVVEVVGSRAE